ncbi:energy transducer TonB [Mucilaginibacter sp. UYCu711]|uniref:energy transducer TonB n=1 Tax=Mucilaginibacter sp. UYCu711 TaxID=3156339 RepID=UPI003D190C0E
MNLKFTLKKSSAPLLFLLAALFVTTIHSSKAAIRRSVTDTIKEGIFSRVDVQPQFPGGLQAFGVFLGNNIKYPADDAKNKVQGRVICKFVVERDGHLSNIEILHTPTEAMGNEAVRVLSLSPKWTPGYQGGRLVRVYYTVPINFSLNR